MPLTLFKWVREVSGLHQCWLAGLSALLFAVGLAPLEVQRRIVNAPLYNPVHGPPVRSR